MAESSETKDSSVDSRENDGDENDDDDDEDGIQ